MTADLSALGAYNRDVFDSADVIAELAALQGWSDLGEREALTLVAGTVRGKAALDIGVGPGRTVPLMRLLTDDYTAVDYSAGAVATCRNFFPDVDARVADARDLSVFEDARFGFVMFSYNGLDTLDHSDRISALKEMVRVLAPGGILLYSTLNKDGISYGEVPWQFHRRGERVRLSGRAIARGVLEGPRRAARKARAYRNWRAHRELVVDRGDWAIGSLAAHEFRPLVHFTTLRGVIDELASLEVDPLRIFDSSGRVVDTSNERDDADYFHVISRRRPL